ncbi:MAG: FAD-binding protein [Caulobacteraceae bacterium]
MDPSMPGTTRRQLLHAIGLVGGTAALYNAMTTLGHAAGDPVQRPPNLQGGNGKSVIVLGAGLAGMLAAYELNKAATRCGCWSTRTVRAGGTGRSTAATPTPSSAGRPSTCSSSRATT